MANRHKHLNQNLQYEPSRCWVGDTHKIIYATEEEAELAARVAEHDHGLAANSLRPYRCPYADHYHLSSE